MTDFAKLILDADTSGLRRAKDALQDVARQSKSTAVDVDSNAYKIGASLSNMAKVGVGLAVGAVASLAAGFVALGLSAINTADEIYMASMRIGIGTEELSRLKYAAEQSGLSFEQLQTSVGRLSRNMYDASRGVGQGKAAFDALGISVTDADGRMKTTTQVMQEIADKFAGMEDGAQKTAIAMELMGRSGTQMIPMLNEGAAGIAALTAEAERFGIVIDEETGARAEQFNDNLARLQGAVGALAAGIAADLLPYALRLTEWFIDAIPTIRRFVAATAAMFNPMIQQIRTVLGWIQRLREAMQARGIDTGLRYGLPSGGAAQNPFAGAIEGARQARDMVANLGSTMVSVGSAGGAAVRAGIAEPLEAANDNATRLQSLLDRLFPEVARLRQLSEEMAMVGDNAGARSALQNEFVESIVGSNIGAKTNEALAALGSVDDAMEASMRRIDAANEAAVDGNARVARSFEDMATDALSALQRLASGVQGGGVLGIISGLLGVGLQLGQMGVFGSSFQTTLNGGVPKRANGGGVSAGQSYLVGERGPELFTPNGNGYVAANNNSTGGLNVTITMDQSTGAMGAFVRNQAGQVVAQAAPAMVEAGGQAGFAQMARANSRRWR